MGEPGEALFIRQMNTLADKAGEIAPGKLNISLYAAIFSQYSDREKTDITEQIRVIFRSRGLLWSGD